MSHMMFIQIENIIEGLHKWIKINTIINLRYESIQLKKKKSNNNK